MILKFNKKILIKVAKFLVILNILAIPMLIVIYLDWTWTPLQTAFTYLTFWTLKLLGYSVHLDTLNITTDVPFIIYSDPSYPPYRISWDSTGWKTMYLLTILTFAAPVTSIMKKLKFLALGLPLMFSINFLRIVSTLMLAFTFGKDYFEIVHTFLWSEGLVFAVVAIWYLWVRHKL